MADLESPIHVARGSPPDASFFLKNGFRSLITFSSNSNIKLWEKSVTPPGFDTGAMVPLGSLQNQLFRIYKPSDLITVTECRVLVAYDTEVISDILSLCENGDSEIITVTFPNSRRWSYPGCLQKFMPNELSDGMQPTALATIAARMFNNSKTKTPEIENTFNYS